MKCSESQNYMMKYFDKDMNDIEEAQMKQHIKTCTKCSEEFAGLKAIFTHIEEDIIEIEPPEDFELQVMNRIQHETEIYKKPVDNSKYVFNVLLSAMSFIFVIFFGGFLWEAVNHPLNLIQNALMLAELAKEFISAAVTMFKGMSIAIVGVAASIYSTYYYAYILLAVLLLVIQRVFIKMVREGNGGAQ